MKRAHDAWKTIWITGASSGIGRSTALRLADKGRTICLSGRSTARLETVASQCRDRGSTVVIVPFDIGIESDRSAAIDEVRSRGLEPDLLINNAGVSQRDWAINTGYTTDRRITEINYLGSIHLTKAVLPGMVERGTGTIAVVSSIAGLLPSRLRSAYNGAKAAQISYFRTLANELWKSGVTITIVIPGFVRTAVSENALHGDGSIHGQLDSNQANGADPDDAAKDIVNGLLKKRSTIFTGVPIGVRGFLLLGGIAPKAADGIFRRVTVR